MSDWLGLDGRRALVAGIGGLGFEIAAALAEQGANVVVSDQDSQALDRAQALKSQPRGAPIVRIRADLSIPDQCEAAVAEAQAHLGGLDIFIHAVGINDRRPVLETPNEVWEKIIAVNQNSAFWLGRAVGAVMVPGGYGRIVYISSVSGLLGHKFHAPYAASKGAINQLVKVMAHEWAADGVTVNAIAPGYTRTDLTAAYLERPGVLAALESMVPAGRLGTAEDTVGAALFLSSDRAEFITGQVVYVDGGRTLV